MTSQDAIVRLYVHETSRVFGDRLVTDKERDKFTGFQVDSMQKYFKVRVLLVQGTCFSGSRILHSRPNIPFLNRIIVSTPLPQELATKIVFTKRHVIELNTIFTDFHIQLSSEETVKRYRIVPDNNQLLQTLTDFQNRFNVSESQVRWCREVGK